MKNKTGYIVAGILPGSQGSNNNLEGLIVVVFQLHRPGRLPTLRNFVGMTFPL